MDTGVRPFLLILVSVSLISQGLCSTTKRPGIESWYRPPAGWLGVAKAYLNTMANRMAGLGRNASESITNSQRSLMTDAVKRVDEAGKKMSGAKQWASSGWDKAKNRTGAWVNTALNWITG